MSFKPLDWNVVVVGRWNLAILTPSGIRKYIFGLPEIAQLRISVPLDGISPYMVADPNNEITVIPNADRIIIKPQSENYSLLEKAMQAGAKVLQTLPETPVSATGFNIRFSSNEISVPLADILNSSIDSELDDLKLNQIACRTINRSISYKDGVINLGVEIKENPEESTVIFNFHQGSNERQKLLDWLNLPIGDIEKITNLVLGKLELTITEE